MENLPVSLSKAGNWLKRRQKTVLISAILIQTGVISAICLWKYAHLGYNGIDLAIYNQLFWNMLDGRFFIGSIHPHSYLGDHAELLLPVLLPFYAAFSDPRTLLILQAAALALPAVPIYLLARQRLRGQDSLLPLGLALTWLMNPAIQNIGLFEFHFLPFALPPLFFALLEYEKGRKIPFLIYAALALLVREDVALVIMAIGAIAWMEKKPSFWRLAPPAIGLVWFIAAMTLIARFSPTAGYKFAVYYSWLGVTPLAAAGGIILHPIRTLSHVITLANLEMILGLTLPLAFLPFFRPRYLILAAGPLLQIVLGAPGGGELILRTHYATLFLPGLFLAATIALENPPAMTDRLARVRFPSPKETAPLIAAVCVVFSCLAFGPLPTAASSILSPGQETGERARTAKAMLGLIPPDAPVVAGYSLLAPLSSRQEIYSLHYQFLGVSQFAAGPYAIPESTRYLALDTRDLLFYPAQFLETAWTRDRYAGGYARLRQAAGNVIFSSGDHVLLDKEAAVDGEGPPLQPVINQGFDGSLNIRGAALNVEKAPGKGSPVLRVKLLWMAESPPDSDLTMRLYVKDKDKNTVLERDYPFGNGLVPAMEIGPRGALTEVGVPLDSLKTGRYRAAVALLKEKSRLRLDALGTIVRDIEKSEVVGTADLPAFGIGDAP